MHPFIWYKEIILEQHEQRLPFLMPSQSSFLYHPRTGNVNAWLRKTRKSQIAFGGRRIALTKGALLTVSVLTADKRQGWVKSLTY
jgi:hypothetical protein